MSDVPDPEVPEWARRTYTAKYKADVLAEYEAADRAGKGAVLRRDGLYSSLISAWRDQRDSGALAALARSSGPAPVDPAQRGAARLRKENELGLWALSLTRRAIAAGILTAGAPVESTMTLTTDSHRTSSVAAADRRREYRRPGAGRWR